MGRLDNKVAVVTGAGGGIGGAISRLYAAEGAKVIVSDMNLEAAQAIVNEITERGGQAAAVRTNVTVEDDIDQMIQTAIDTFGTVDILVNNAGILDNMTSAAAVTDELWDRVLDINTKSVMRTMRKVLPIFEQKQNGIIVNVASLSGVAAGRGGLTYTASKFAVVGMTKNVASHYGHLGIRCNAIAPGSVATNLTKSITNPEPFGMKQSIAGTNLMTRPGAPEEIASIALFLASNDASYVNGTVVTADGGWSAY